jgi:HEAT repeat protein
MKKLLRNITHEDPSIRRSAAESLSEGDERAIYPLIKALRDDNFGVQDAAMHSLMAMRGEVTAYMVLPLLREDSFLRNTALVILTEIGEDAIPLLPELLNDKDDDVRKFALDLIHDIKHCDYPDKVVELIEKDPNTNVRAAAAEAIGKLQFKDAVPHLINALNDEEWVCFSALEALTEMQDDSSIDAIEKLLGNSSETIRFAAIETLGKINTPKSIKALMNHIEIAEGFERKATISNLIKLGTVPSAPGVSDTLIELLNDGEWDEKLLAIRGLVELNEASAIKHIIDIAGQLDTSNPDDEDKLYFIKESFNCDNELIEILNNQDFKFRGKVLAIETVGNIQCKGAVPSLINLLKSDLRDVRRSSIQSLAKIDSDDAKDCLIDAVSDHDSHVRRSAITALGKIGDMSSFEPLMKMLKSEKFSDVIYEFVIALMNINSEEFLSRINEFSDNVREIASNYSPDLFKGAAC